VLRHVAAIADCQVLALPPAVKQRLIRFSWQATILLVLEVFVWNRSEVLFLERFSTIEMVAFFSISFGAAQSVILVSRVAATAAGMTLMAESGRDADRVGRLAADVAYFMALLSVPLAAVVAGLASPLIELFYGPHFAPAAPVLAILAAVTPFRAVFFAGQYLLVARDDQRPLIYACTFGALVDVSLAIVLVPVLGALGAGLTKALTMAVTTLATWYLIGHRHKIQLPLKRLGALLAIGIGAGAAMHVTAKFLAAWAAIPVAMVIGMALLAIGMRFVGAIDARTRDRLLRLQVMVPTSFNKLYVAIVAKVATRRETDGVPKPWATES
jgi:O-antigen/teichoic acid export membrane protein